MEDTSAVGFLFQLEMSHSVMASMGMVGGWGGEGGWGAEEVTWNSLLF